MAKVRERFGSPGLRTWVAIGIALACLVISAALYRTSTEAAGMNCGSVAAPESAAARAWEDIYVLQEALESGGDPCPNRIADQRVSTAVTAGAGVIALAAGGAMAWRSNSWRDRTT